MIKENKNRSAFTLAEMMIVMLILTILLAAFAPLMTKRGKVDLSSPWRWAANNSDIYYGMGNNQTAMIGQNNKAATDPNAKLLIYSPNGSQTPHITFKEGDEIVGNLLFKGTNIGLGYKTLTSLNPNVGQNNVGIGYETLQSLHAGYYNVGIGSRVLKNIKNKYGNVGVGNEALTATTDGEYNVAVGTSAMHSNTTGSNNVAIGYNALSANTSGSNNIAIGYNACSNVETGSNKVCIGNDSGPKADDQYRNKHDRIIYLGDEHTVVYIPGHLMVDKFALLGKSDELFRTFIRLGNSDAAGAHRELAGINRITEISNASLNQNIIYDNLWNFSQAGYPPIPGLLQARTGDTPKNYPRNLASDDPSDKRLKNINGENTAGIEQIRQLKVFNYTFKKDEAKTPHVGVIAQDLIKIFPDAVTTGEDGYLRIRKEDMFYASINAIKELDKMLQDLVAQVKTVVAQVAEHDTQIKALQDENKELKNKVQTLEKRLDAIEKRL